MIEEKNEKKPRARRPYRPRNMAKTNSSKNEENTKIEEVKKEKKHNTALPKRMAYNKRTPKFEFKKSNLKVIPLGGLEEIGNNMTIFEYEDEMIVVDCGLEFPTDDMLGVDLVIPDVTYLERNKEKVKAFVITHGHEDHIGAIPYVLRQLNVPIYGTKLTLGLIKNKLEEHKLLV